MTKTELIKAYQEATNQSGVQAKTQLEQLGDIMDGQPIGKKLNQIISAC